MRDESTANRLGLTAGVPAESGEEAREPDRFVNYFRCPVDNAHWADSWSCACNDKCPTCGREIEPYKSLDL